MLGEYELKINKFLVTRGGCGLIEDRNRDRPLWQDAVSREVISINSGQSK